MRILRDTAWVIVLAAIAACGSGSDATAPKPTTNELTCVNPTATGAAVTCSLTLAQSAGLRAVLTDHRTCEAHGDLFYLTAPVADTLTVDGCFDTVGKELDAAGPYQSGTQVTMELKPGLLVSGSPGVAAVRPNLVVNESVVVLVDGDRNARRRR